jgi:uncharacterized protein YjbI with pentapeptide repeats
VLVVHHGGHRLHRRQPHQLIFYNLSGANLANADLTASRLAGSINGATITGTKLADATFDSLTSAGLIGQPASLPTAVSLVSGYLVGPGTYLIGVDLHGQDLRAITFTGTQFSGGDLTGADLRGASFTGARLSSVFLNNAKIDGTNLSGVTSFFSSDLTGATGTPLYAGTRFEDSTCPDGTSSRDHGDTCQSHPWP